MSKSLEFCIKRASNPDVSNLYDRPWEQATEVDSWDMFKSYLGADVNSVVNIIQKDSPIAAIVLEHKPDADFTYFTSESACHDGTLLFILELYEKIIYKIAHGLTYDKTVGSPKKHVHYTFGNFVFLDEFGDFGGEDKPWMHERTTILLPIKYETFDQNENFRGQRLSWDFEG